MLKYILRRIIQFIPMVFFLTVIVFLFAYLAPGDALSGEAIDPNTPREVIEERRAALGLNDPIHIQYWNWLRRAVTGDLGMSTHFTGRSVSELISQRLGNTFYLGAFALFVTLIVSVPIGIYSARKKYSVLDYAATSFAFVGLATPNFFAGLLAIYVFSFGLGWFPTQGSIGSPGLTGFEAFISRIQHLVLPGVTLGLSSTAIFMRYMRSEMLDIKGSDFIRTARAKGIGANSVLYKHTLRNAMIPIVTLLGMEIGMLLSGAFIVETVFNYPGIGTLFLSGMSNRDYPVIMAVNLLIGLSVLIGNLLADIFYAVIDPRIRLD
ncbi:MULTISPECIES: ABC transporter permease [Shouchella]|uniref:Oligopeptide transport system permease protein n=3 Tax=Bacillaceae TaxID=186817 RepID=A0A060M357_9BACI|nr:MULTISPECIES: ABC transporter permease [Bacillaceae]RQW20805.1 ABC transporter permease [Bacillus sp. C1-1]AIC94973.1 oligopeptide transport system permease protein [Shouchella lehensis G1]KQL58107.1 peptide permease [Alkalicoccobacillus plakortidis]MBG9784184.1 peptide permease [Shouchella lehensis]TES50830.1 ABC transporter permease [Shouchella lehensis]